MFGAIVMTPALGIGGASAVNGRWRCINSCLDTRSCHAAVVETSHEQCSIVAT